MVSHRAWIAPLAAVCVLSACDSPQEEGAGSPNATAQVEQPSLPAVEPPMDRRALLLAIAESASAYAAGRADQQVQRDLQGKRFEIRLRFGCPGDDMAGRSWTLDAEERTVRFRIDPDVGIGKRLIGGLDLTGIESAQGFSVERPWLLEAACPAQISSDGVPASKEPVREANGRSDGPSRERSAPRLAIVQAFTEDDPRTHLGNDRPLMATARLADNESVSDAGYNLTLSGRLVRRRDGAVIACRSERSDVPPSCIVWANFDRIVLSERDGEVIAEWSGG